MTAFATIIQKPQINFSQLLTVAFRALGRSPAQAVDSIDRPVTDIEKYLSCLAALDDAKAGAAWWPHLFGHVAIGVLILGDTEDVLDLITAVSGAAVAATQVNSGALAVVTANLTQWRNAVRQSIDRGFYTDFFSRLLTMFELADIRLWDMPVAPNLLESK